MLRSKVIKVWNGINGILIASVVCLTFALVGVKLFGIETYVVLSGSMEPVYQTGSLIYVKEKPVEGLETGDVITFRLDGDMVATHRIVEVTEENGEVAFRTKGDANEATDGNMVLASQVIGSPIFTIPYLGYLVTYIQSTSGRYAAIAVGAALLLMMFLPDIIFGNDKKTDDKESKEKSE